MGYFTIFSGVLLTGLGALYLRELGMDRILHGILPLLAGILITLFGLLNVKRNGKNLLYGSLMLAILMVIGSLFDFLALLTTPGNEALSISDEILIRSGIAAISLFFIAVSILVIDDFWTGWKAFGHLLGDWVGRAAMTVFYFTVFLPFGLGVTLLGDPLQIKKQPGQLWQVRSSSGETVVEGRRQF